MTVLLEITDAKAIEFNAGEKYPVFKNFNHDQLLGSAIVSRKDDKLYADIKTQEDISELFPSVGFKAIDWSTDNKNMFLEKGELITIGLCDSPNEDKRIPKVKDNE